MSSGEMAVNPREQRVCGYFSVDAVLMGNYVFFHKFIGKWGTMRYVKKICGVQQAAGISSAQSI